MAGRSKRQKQLIKQIKEERGVSWSVAAFIYDCLPMRIKKRMIVKTDRRQ